VIFLQTLRIGSEAKKVQEERNRVVHTDWMHFKDTQPDVTVSLRMSSKKPFGDLETIRRVIFIKFRIGSTK
jgi:hypothetical protein